MQLVGTGSYTGATPAGGLHEFSIQRSPALARLSPDALAIQLTEGYSEEDAKYEVKVQNTGSVAIRALRPAFRARMRKILRWTLPACRKALARGKRPPSP